MKLRKSPRFVRSAVLASMLVCCAHHQAQAAEPAKATQDATKSSAIVSSLLTQDLANIPGKEVTMLTVEYLPGASSQPHRHDAEVFVYVLEGAIIMQVDGAEPVTLRPGQIFREKPGDVHRKSANASATERAKFLVFVVKDKGQPVTRPLTDAR
jgi:quercetin dioxygenase-like cupin family protein